MKLELNVWNDRGCEVKTGVPFLMPTFYIFDLCHNLGEWLEVITNKLETKCLKLCCIIYMSAKI